MAKLICRVFGHSIMVLPFLPGSHQNWTDVVCRRCGKVKTIMGGENF